MQDPTLKRLAALSKTLNEASDLISKHIGTIEAALAGLRLGVEAWVEVERGTELLADKKDDQKDGKKEEKGHSYVLTRVVMLGYAKHGGKWGLLVSEGYEEFFDGDDIGERTLLREAKREVKLAGVDKIPALLAEIEQRAGKLTQEASAKAQQVKSIAASLGKMVG